MNVRTFIGRRIAAQLLRLRGTGDSLTVEVGDAYYQIASYDGNQLLVEVTANQFLPDGAGLDAAAQKSLLGLGFATPDEEWPNWTIRMDDATNQDVVDAAIACACALLDVFEVDALVILNALLDEFIRSHQEFDLDPEWSAALLSTARIW